MDDIELLKLENKGLRYAVEQQAAELRILRRYRQLIERSTQIAANIEMGEKPALRSLTAER